MSARIDTDRDPGDLNRFPGTADPVSFIFEATEPFEASAWRIHRLQAARLPVYGRFAKALMAEAGECSSLDTVPLLPIRAFREHDLVCDRATLPPPPQGSEMKFSSSGTTGSLRSRHIVRDPRIYRESVIRGFDRLYGASTPYGGHVLISYLPGYSDNPESSLIAMAGILSSHRSGAMSFPFEPSRFMQAWSEWSQASSRPPVILFGAAFGLLDLIDGAAAAGSPTCLHLPPHSIVIETGGMKTRRREIPRNELHRRLSEGFGVPPLSIHSEFGMCEMLSQAYSTDGAWFQPPPWLMFQIRHPDNPLASLPPGMEGKLGFIDLANLHSCAFVLTDDHAVMDEQGRVRVFGRWEGSESRGCNFLIDRD